MFLEEIIDNVQLENDKFECKGILNREDVIGWLKTIAGFANASGGDLIAKLPIMNETILITRSMNI